MENSMSEKLSHISMSYNCGYYEIQLASFLLLIKAVMRSPLNDIVNYVAYCSKQTTQQPCIYIKNICSILLYSVSQPLFSHGTYFTSEESHGTELLR